MTFYRVVISYSKHHQILVKFYDHYILTYYGRIKFLIDKVIRQCTFKSYPCEMPSNRSELKQKKQEAILRRRDHFLRIIGFNRTSYYTQNLMIYAQQVHVSGTRMRLLSYLLNNMHIYLQLNYNNVGKHFNFIFLMFDRSINFCLELNQINL